MPNRLLTGSHSNYTAAYAGLERRTRALRTPEAQPSDPLPPIRAMLPKGRDGHQEHLANLRYLDREMTSCPREG
jgi:hypothetical protein